MAMARLPLVMASCWLWPKPWQPWSLSAGRGPLLIVAQAVVAVAGAAWECLPAEVPSATAESRAAVIGAEL